MTKEYRMFAVNPSEGMSSTDNVNKYLANNPDYSLWNVVPVGQLVYFVLERTAKGKHNNDPIGGGTEAALLVEHSNVISLRRAA